MFKPKFLLLLLLLIPITSCNNNNPTSTISSVNSSESIPTTSTPATSIPTDPGTLPITKYTGDASQHIDVGLATPVPANPNFYLHFYKTSEDYRNWFAWVWSAKPKGIGGCFYFQQVDIIDGKKWATIMFDTTETLQNISTNWDNLSIKSKFEYAASLKQVGMLIRDKNGTKEMQKDRIIDMLEFDADGNIHAYISENENKISQLYSDFQGNSLQSALLNNNYKTIEVKSSTAFKSDTIFTLKNDEGNIEVANTVLSNQNMTATLTLSSELAIDNLAKNSTVTVPDYGSIALDYTNIYDTAKFIDNYTTTEPLGVIYTPQSSTFKLWAPTASRVVLNIYNSSSPDIEPFDSVDLTRGEKGVWSYTRNADMHGRYYTYDLNFGTLKRKEVIDPYAKSAGVNGDRGYIYNPEKANPFGWGDVKMPDNVANNDAVVYEMHVRDFTNHSSWNGSDENRGKYLGMIESGTTYVYDGKTYKTGFDYLTDPSEKLGINYLQLQPIYDYSSVDEAKLDDPEYNEIKYSGPFNWGYDPQNYAAPEGSYSSNPANGLARVSELKQVSKAYNDAGIGLIMDVVYNHMPSQGATSLDQVVPNYYFRGRNDSGAGADMASERVMYRKFMVDTCVDWVKEYKLAGFRFDLMGLIDVKTMNEVSDAVKAAVKEINPNATPIIYGEGWDMYHGNDIGDMAVKGNVDKMHNVGAFNDSLSYALRGDGNDTSGSKGWVSGETYKAESVKDNIAANFSTQYAGNATNYVSTHDNLTIYDKLQFTNPEASEADLKQMSLFANSIVLTTQGTAFFEIGTEMLRSKQVPGTEAAISDKIISNGFKYFNRDSYNGADWFSNIRWNSLGKHADLINAYRNLIKMRLEQGIFHANTIGGVIVDAKVIDNGNGVEVKLTNSAKVSGKWNSVTMVYNARSTTMNYTFPAGQYIGFVNNQYAPDGTASGFVSIPARSIAVSYAK